MSSACRPYSSRELTCAICRDYFTDPVTIACGHSFCAPCLCLLWEDTKTPTRCPLCRAVSLPMDFRSTILAKKKVLPSGQSVFFQLPSSTEQVCKTHRIIKIFFCPVDKILLCLLCCYSPDHVTHIHRPVKKAANHHRVSNASKCTWKPGRPCICWARGKLHWLLLLFPAINKYNFGTPCARHCSKKTWR